jgi:hypothetical protein
MIADLLHPASVASQRGPPADTTGIAPPPCRLNIPPLRPSSHTRTIHRLGCYLAPMSIQQCSFQKRVYDVTKSESPTTIVAIDWSTVFLILSGSPDKTGRAPNMFISADASESYSSIQSVGTLFVALSWRLDFHVMHPWTILSTSFPLTFFSGAIQCSVRLNR